MASNQEICDMIVKTVQQITGVGHAVKLKQPNDYSGERDVRIIDNWYSAIETHKEFYGWDDDKTFIFASTLLSGRAAEWLRVYKEHYPHNAPKTWSTLKSELTQNFRPTRSADDARDSLDNLKQTRSMQKYCDAFMDIAMLVPGMTQEEQCHKFRKGIQDMELQAQLRDYPPENRKLQTYFTHALNYAATRPYLDSGGGSSFGDRGIVSRVPQQQNYYQHGAGGISSAQDSGEPMDLDAMDSRRGGSGDRTIVCYFCHKPGHIKRNCRERIEAIRNLDNSHRNNRGGSSSSGSWRRGGKKQTYKNPRGKLYAIDNTSDDLPPTDSFNVDANKLNTSCEHYLKGSTATKENASKAESITGKIVDSLSVRLACDDPYLDQLNAATSASSSDLPLYGGYGYSHGDGHVSVKVLVDSGASECYIKPSIARQLKCIWSKVEREVETAGGSVHKISDKVDYVLNLQGYEVPVSSFVYDSKFDIILGRSWLKQH